MALGNHLTPMSCKTVSQFILALYSSFEEIKNMEMPSYGSNINASDIICDIIHVTNVKTIII